MMPGTAIFSACELCALIRSGVLLAVLLSTFATPVNAQDGAVAREEITSTHWAFSSFLGTGWYEVSSDRSVFVLRIPPMQTIRKSGFTESGERQIGIELLFPLSVGFNSIEDIPGLIEPENFGSYSFTPGVELEIPVRPDWYLRASGHFGWGKESASGNDAWIYYGALRSRYTPGNSKLDWSLLNSLSWAGYTPDVGPGDSFSLAMAGAEFRQPLNWSPGGTPMRLDWHLTYSWMFNAAVFQQSRLQVATIDDQWELGLALSPRDRSFKLWFVEFEHVGLSFRMSSDGNYKAVTVNLSSPFSG